MLARFVVHFSNALLRERGNVKGIVDFGHARNLFFGKNHRIVEERKQLFALLLGSTFEGVDEQESFLATKDVAPNLLAKHGWVAIDIEVVVLKLERQTDLFGKGIKRIAISLGRICHNAAHLCCTRQEHRGLQANHFKVFRLSHVRALLKVHVILLPLTHLNRGVDKELARFVSTLALARIDKFERLNKHRVTRKDCRIGIPTAVNGRFTTAHLCPIHEVVVEERVVVIHLNSDCGTKCFIITRSIKTVRQKRQYRTDALTPHFKGVRYGFIKTFGLLREGNVVDKLFDLIQHE